MIFRRSRKTVKKGARSMDKIVTGIIVGGAAASIFGLSRTKKGKRFTQKIMDTGEKCTRAGISIFGKMTLEFLSWFQKKK